jgi:hypothetical protein
MTAMALNLLCAMGAPASDPKPAVRKGDGGMTEQRLDWHLENWAEWHFRHNKVGYGAPSRAGSGLGRSHRTTFEDMVESADTRCAEAVEASVDDLTPIERFAVHHVHLAAVYRFPREARGHQEAYERARAKIKRGLGSRSIL